MSRDVTARGTQSHAVDAGPISRVSDDDGVQRHGRALEAPLPPLNVAVEAVERQLLVDALALARGRRTAAAKLLATTERVFRYKVRKYGIDWRRFR